MTLPNKCLGTHVALKWPEARVDGKVLLEVVFAVDSKKVLPTQRTDERLRKELKEDKERWLEEKSKLDENIRTLKKSEEERRRLGGDVERLEVELTKMTQIKENNTTLSTELERIRDEKRILEADIHNIKEELKIKSVLEEDNLCLSSELKSMSEENHKMKSENERLENMATAHSRELEVNHSKEAKLLKEEKQRVEEERY
ncbi:hypothetical protein Pmani_018732 [Petrolisthes manimaculis]|uniref:Uncharacterized protein n=1 Tax=Petrolisthes manimaculis TaxID=1843537 RepID=A0AAE1U6D4_9EUCA|nr:hypothetical protein Pmani_018732 [Petrolisthes manimaculis]